MGVKGSHSRSRYSSALETYKLGSLDFDALARKHFFCFARSCRIIEKFDENHENVLKSTCLVFSDHEHQTHRVRKSAGAGPNAPVYVLSQPASNMSVETSRK